MSGIPRSELLEWVASGESESLEFKRSTALAVEGCRSLCAMLNHCGGRVLFGVEDDGRVVGQEVSDSTLRKLSEEIGRIDPPVYPSIETVVLPEGRQALVVSTSPGTNRPYTYKGESWRRRGSTNVKLSRDEADRMLLERVHGEQRWENRPAPDWSVADLDTRELVLTVEEAIRRGRAEDPGTRDPAELLRGLDLMKDDTLLRAALVLFGRAERLELEMPQCLLRVAKFRGIDKSEFLDNRQLHGNAFELLRKGERFLRENLPVAGRVTPGLFERIDDPLYPPVALREALANAFCHRDYSIGGGSVALAIYDDRLEVTSSGPLHFGLTAESLFEPHESMPWNPLVARVFYRRGVIESERRGTIKRSELTSSAGLPRPEIEDGGGCVTVRFRPTRYVPPQRVGLDVTERQQRILAVLAEARAGLALAEIVARIDAEVSVRQVRDELAHLRRLQLVKLEGHGRGSRWKCL